MTVVGEETTDVVTAKFADAAPPGTNTEGGTDATAAFELAKLTVTPLPVAGPVNVTCPLVRFTASPLSVTAVLTAPEFGSTIRPLSSTASRLDPSTYPSVCSEVSFQRESGVPVRYHDEPLSAISAPYFFSARRITWTSAG